MKRILFFAAIAAAVALSSCSKNEIEVVADDPSDAISFSTYVGTANRGATVMSKFESGDSFGVFAQYTGTTAYSDDNYEADFMYNQKVGYDGSTWSYTPLKYWPNDVTSDNEAGKVSFFAYWPMADATNGITVPTVDNMSVPRVLYDASAQTDLMWGVDVADSLAWTDMTKQSTAVNFLFKHALARVGFEVELGDDILKHASTDGTTTVTVNSIKFGYVEGSNVEEAGDTDGLNEKAYLYLNNKTKDVAKWVNQATSSEYSLKLAGATDFEDANDVDVPAVFTLAGAAGVSVGYNETISNGSDEYFMIIPQDMSATGASLKMRITYTVNTTDEALGDKKSEIVNISTFDVSQNFASGKAYKYIFTLNLGSVDMEATDPTEWTDASTDVAVPYVAAQ
ncbi:MAG: fimbrillin family protein [Bacteroidales bacterium]